MMGVWVVKLRVKQKLLAAVCVLYLNSKYRSKTFVVLDSNYRNKTFVVLGHGRSLAGAEEPAVSEPGVTDVKSGEISSWSAHRCCGPEGWRRRFKLAAELDNVEVSHMLLVLKA